jgi:hypothetical protein
LRIWGVPISLHGYTLLQLTGAAVCAGVCGLAWWNGAPHRWLLMRLLVVALGWMMLLGPATESNTYALLAPLACWVAVWVHCWGTSASRYLLGLAIGLWLLCVVSCAVPAGRSLYHASGLQPLAVICLLAGYFLCERANSAATGSAQLRLTAATPIVRPSLVRVESVEEPVMAIANGSDGRRT